MKKIVIFHYTYIGNDNSGNRTSKRTYPFFTRKSTIVNDFNYWITQEHKIVKEFTLETPYITDLKIIGL